MKLFLRKYLKAPIALLVCLVMVLQLLPAPQPAQAGFWDIIKKIVKGIPLPPEITFTDEAKIRVGSERDPTLEIPTPWSISGVGNPFNKLSLGGGGLPLIDAETGQPAGYCWEAISCYVEQGQVKRVTAGALSNTEAFLDNVYAPQIPEAVKNDVLTSPAKVKQVLKDALGFEEGLDAYKLKRLRDGDKWRRVWAQYWLDLGKNKLGDANPSVKNLATEMMLWPENQGASLIYLREGNDVSAVQVAILANASNSYLSPLTALDNEKGFGSQNKEAFIDDYAQDSKNKCCYIGKPLIPEECELGIRYPGDDACATACDEKRTPLLREACRESCNEEKMAHRQACTHFIRLQKAAADIAFLAKKIYNSTNPLDDCFFLKNCKSKCLLSYGEVKYVITWLDIAQFLLPTAWLTVIKQVMGVIAALGQIKQAYDALKSLLTDGLELISGFFDTFHYLTTMFTALQNIGGTMSASIGVASVAASALDATGILSIPGNAVQFGAVAGAATVLAADSKGVNAMQGMLKRFSDNLLNYSTAKSETNKLLLGMRQNLLDVMEGNDETKGAKHETELAFFFEPNNPVRKNLDNIVGNFQADFKSLASLLDSAIGPGQLPTGSGVDKLGPGSWQEFQKNNAEPVLDFKAREDGNGGVYIINTAFGDKNIKSKNNFCDADGYHQSDSRICMFNGDRVLPWSSDITCPETNLDTIYSNLISKLNPARSADYQIIIDRTKAQYIKDMLDAALGCGCVYDKNATDISLEIVCDEDSQSRKTCKKDDKYLMEYLKDGEDYKDPWELYWQRLGRIILGDSSVNGHTLDEIELAIIKKEGFSFLSSISALDNKGNDGDYDHDGKRSATQALINDYTSVRENSGLFPVICDSTKVGIGVTWLDNFQKIFTESLELQSTLKLIDPIYIRDMLIGEGSVMACAFKTGRCKLNYSVKGWREYWEGMARGLGATTDDLSGDDMHDRHTNAIEYCVDKNDSLKPFALLDSDYPTGYDYPKGLEDRDRGYINATDNPIGDILDKSDLGAIQKAIFNKTDILGNTKPFAFLAPIAALDDKGFYGNYDEFGTRTRAFAEIDKYSVKRTASGLFPAAATPVYTTLIANLDGDPAKYLKVVERTEPAYLKNVLDAALGCGCTFDSNAEEVSQEIFCDEENNMRDSCNVGGMFKYAVLDDSKTAWHYLWVRLGRIILQAETKIECLDSSGKLKKSSDMKDYGTKAFIRCQLVGYQMALDEKRDAGVKNDLAVTVGGKISAILNTITAFTYQKNYLESPDRHTSPPNDKEQRARHFTDAVVASWPLATQQEMKEKGEEGSDYWQSQLWCAGGCKVTALPASELQKLQALEALAKPENVKTVLRAALGVNTDHTPPTAYNMNELEVNKSDWFNFWVDLAKIVLGSNFTKYLSTMDKEEYISGLQTKINAVNPGDSFTRDLSKLDNENGHGWQNKNNDENWQRMGDYDNYASLGALTNTEKYITEVYKPKWDLYYSQANTESAGTASRKFSESYDPDIAKYDWDARANKIVSSVKDLKTIVFGLNNGLSPQYPAIIASIEKDAKEFADAIEKGKLAMDDFQKLRWRDCDRWQYFFRQEHNFKQYGDGGSHDCDDCPCSSRACLEWTSIPAPNGFNWCAVSPSLPSCKGQICDCCSKKSDCANQRNILENTLHPKCYVYIPDCVAAESYKDRTKKLRDNCLANPCQYEKRVMDDCLLAENKDESKCQDEKKLWDDCKANPCQYEINDYNGAVNWVSACWIQRATYTAEEIKTAEAANIAASAESNALWGFFSGWWAFDGETDLDKVKDKDPNDYYYYKNKYGYKTLREIEQLILALQIVWQDDLTTVDARERLARTLDIFVSEECQGNAWVYDPGQRCTSKMIKVNHKVDDILVPWQSVRRSTMDSASNSAARPAKDYTASIVSSKIIAQEISSKIRDLKSYFEGSPEYPMNSPKVMEDKIAKDLAYLPADQKQMLMDIITEFKTPYNAMKTEVIDAIDKSIGKYTYDSNPGLSNICPNNPNNPDDPTNIDKLGFLDRVACFEYCGGLSLDQCLKPETVTKSHKFEQLMPPLSAIENIEDAIFLLTDAKLDIDEISSVQESVANLQPEIQPQNVVSINTNLINDFNAKLSGKIKDVLNKYNPLKEGGIETNPAANKKLQLFNDSKGGPADFKDFASSLADNPLKFLNEQFINIEDQFKTIKKRLQDTGGLLSNFYSDTRGGKYYDMTDKVRTLKMDELNLKINGNQALVGACSALGLILQGDITEMNRVCSQKADGGELLSKQLRNWVAVNAQGDSKQKTCDIWLALADDITDVAMINREIAALQAHRNCIGNNCIMCPTWFCANPPNGTWGAGAMQNDQYCVEKCAHWQPGQNTGYVCATNNIIWDTADFGQPVSAVPTTAICEGLGFMSSPLCTVAKVNTRCQAMDTFFGVSTGCDIFDSCSATELQRQANIKKWSDQIALNKCPKWLCLNENGILGPLVNNANEDVYCKEIRNGGPFTGDDQADFDKPGDGLYYRNRIIWDTITNPGAVNQVWNGTAATNAKCAEAQAGLKSLGFSPLDPPPPASSCSPVIPIISFCDNKNTCNAMKTACANWAIQQRSSSLTKPLMEWPPSKPSGGYVEGYQSAQIECIRTQAVMTALEKVKAEIEKATANEPQFKVDVLTQLNTDCNELKRQQELKKECDSYGLAKKAVADKCNTVPVAADKDICEDKRTQMNGLCSLASGQNWSSKETYCVNNSDQLKNLLLDTDEAKAGLQKVRNRCAQTLDIRTPLGEIMRVLSILMGIQSGTAAHSGIISSIQGARVFYENVGKFILMIENLHNAMDTAYDDTMAQATTGGGFKVTLFKCVAMPAESVVRGQTLTGPKGGPVCPEVGNIYSQIQANFATIRQEAKSVTQAMYKTQGVDIPLPWGEEAYLHLFDKYKNVGKDYPSIKPLSDRAQELRGEAQFVWAMATAINFANANCTCGMSYCKLPFCISGLPLTLAPLKDPYCALVWMLRTPMIDLGNRLAEDLNKKLDKVK